MLANINRLKDKTDFEKVKKEGTMYQKPFFGVSILKKDKEEPSRFGFVISKKISKKAVERNRINRALHEGVRYNLNRIGEGYDMVFLVKKAIAKKPTGEIMREVDKFVKEGEFRK